MYSGNPNNKRDGISIGKCTVEQGTIPLTIHTFSDIIVSLCVHCNVFRDCDRTLFLSASYNLFRPFLPSARYPSPLTPHKDYKTPSHKHTDSCVHAKKSVTLKNKVKHRQEPMRGLRKTR